MRLLNHLNPLLPLNLLNLLLPLLLLFPLLPLHATQWPVGPTHTYTKPSQVVNLVQDGDTVNIDAGTYTADVAVWKKHNLLLRGAGGFAHLAAGGANAQGKAIWVIQGNNTTVEYIEFSDCAVPDDNGAGIRQEGAGLTVRHCWFHDNQEGILAGDNANSDILIEYTEFDHNGAGDGYSHNLYINHVRTLTFRYNYSHRAAIGHNLKSRAHTSYILYNRIMDEHDGTSSYVVDLPNGGRCFLIGNVLQQGPQAENSTAISFGLEGYNNPAKVFYAVNNTIVNERISPSATFFKVGANADTVLLTNNLYAGPGNFLNYSGTTLQTNNLQVPLTELTNAGNFDYHLLQGSSAIDAGLYPPAGLLPEFQYVHPLSGEPRAVYGIAPDVGAYEFPVNTSTVEINPLTRLIGPNPSSGIFNLSQPMAWVVYDAFFRKVASDWGTTVDLRGKPGGIYFLHVGKNCLQLVLCR